MSSIFDSLHWTWEYKIHPHKERLLGIIALTIITVTLPLTVYIAQQQQDIRQDAAVRRTGLCRDLKPSETIPVSLNKNDNNYLWTSVNYCSKSCKSSLECPKNYSDPYIPPSTSSWCYPFQGANNNHEDWRCIQLQYIGPRTR